MTQEDKELDKWQKEEKARAYLAKINAEKGLSLTLPGEIYGESSQIRLHRADAIVQTAMMSVRAAAEEKKKEREKKKKKENNEALATIDRLRGSSSQPNAKNEGKQYNVTISEQVFYKYNTHKKEADKDAVVPANSNGSLTLLEISSALEAKKQEIDKTFGDSNKLHISHIEKDPIVDGKTQKKIKIVLKERLGSSEVNANKTLTIELENNALLPKMGSSYVFSTALKQERSLKESLISLFRNGTKEYQQETNWLKRWYSGRDNEIKAIEDILNKYEIGKISELEMLQQLTEGRNKLGNVGEIKDGSGKIIGYTSKVWNMLDACIRGHQQQNQHELIDALIGVRNPDSQIVNSVENIDDFKMTFGDDINNLQLREAIIFYLKNIEADKLKYGFYGVVKKICQHLRQSGIGTNDLERLINGKDKILRPLIDKDQNSAIKYLESLVKTQDIEGVKNAVKEISTFISSQKISSKADMERFSKLAEGFKGIVSASDIAEIKNCAGQISDAVDEVSINYLIDLDKLAPTEDTKNVFLEILNGKSWLGNDFKNREDVQNAAYCFIEACLDKEGFNTFELLKSIENNKDSIILQQLLKKSSKFQKVLAAATKAELERLIDSEDHQKIEQIFQDGYLFKIGETEYGKPAEIQEILLAYIKKIGVRQPDAKYCNIFNAAWRKEHFSQLDQELIKAYHSPKHYKQYEDLISVIDSIASGKIPESLIRDHFDLRKIALDFASGLFIPADLLKVLGEKINALQVTGKVSPYAVSLLKAFAARMGNSETETETEKTVHDKLFDNYKSYLTSVYKMLNFIETTMRKEVLFDRDSQPCDTKNFAEVLASLKSEIIGFLKFKPEFNDYVLDDFDGLIDKVIEKIKDFSPSDLSLFAQRFIGFFGEIGPLCFFSRAICKLHVLSALGLSDCRESEVDLMAALLGNNPVAIKEAYKRIEEEYGCLESDSDQKSIIDRISKILVYAGNRNKTLDVKAVFFDAKSGDTKDATQFINKFSRHCVTTLLAEELVDYFSGRKTSNLLIDKLDELTLQFVMKEFSKILSPEQNKVLYVAFEKYLLDILSKYPEIREEQNKQTQSKGEVADDRISPQKINLLCALYECFKNGNDTSKVQSALKEYNFRAMNHVRKLTAFKNMDKKNTALNYCRDQNVFAASMLVLKLKDDPRQINEINSRNDALVYNCVKTNTLSLERDDNTARILWYSSTSTAKTAMQVHGEITRKRKSVEGGEVNPKLEIRYEAVTLSENFRDFILNQQAFLIRDITAHNQAAHAVAALSIEDASESDLVEFNPNAFSLDKYVNILSDYLFKNNLFELAGNMPETLMDEKVKEAWNFVLSLKKTDAGESHWFSFIKNSVETRVQILKVLTLLSAGSHKEVSDNLDLLEKKIFSTANSCQGKNEFQTLNLICLDFIELRSKVEERLSVSRQGQKLNQSQNQNRQRLMAKTAPGGIGQINLDDAQVDWDTSGVKGADESKKQIDGKYAESLNKILENMSVDGLLELLKAAEKNNDGKEMGYLKKAAKFNLDKFLEILAGAEAQILLVVRDGESDQQLLKKSDDLRVVKAIKLGFVENTSQEIAIKTSYFSQSKTCLELLQKSIKEGQSQYIKMYVAQLMSGDSYFQIKAIELLLGNYGFLQNSSTSTEAPAGLLSFVDLIKDGIFEILSLDNTEQRIKDVINDSAKLKELYLKAVLKSTRRERVLNDPTISLVDPIERQNHFRCVSEVISQMIADDQLSPEIKTLIVDLYKQQLTLKDDTYAKRLWNECLSKITGLKELLINLVPEIELVPQPSTAQTSEKSSPTVPRFDLITKEHKLLQTIRFAKSKLTAGNKEENQQRILESIKELRLNSTPVWHAKLGKLLLTEFTEEWAKGAKGSQSNRDIRDNIILQFKDGDQKDTVGYGLKRFYLKAVVNSVCSGNITKEELEKDINFVRDIYVDLDNEKELPKFPNVCEKLATSASSGNDVAKALLDRLMPVKPVKNCRAEVRELEKVPSDLLGGRIFV